jgi:ferric-dicitrate binding protein FerR (iron transport regulator)
MCGAPPVAELAEAVGPVDRDALGAIAEWAPAEVGATFRFGEAVRTRAEATAELDLRGGGRARLEPETVVRFLRAPPGSSGDGDAARLRLETGEATLEQTGEAPLLTDLEIGLARVERGGRVRLIADEDGVRLTVELGLAEVEREDGTTLTLERDQTIAVDLEAAIIERVGSDASETASEDPPDAGPPAPPDAGPPGAAELRVEGDGARIRAPGERRFRRLEDGETLPVAAGTRVRGGRSSTVALRRGEDRASLSGPGELEVGPDDGPLARLVRGRADLAAGSGGELVVDVPGGAIVLRGGEGTAAEVTTDRRRTTSARVLRGEAEIRGQGDERAVLGPGQSARLDRRGRLDAPEPPPEIHHVVIPTGESATVHDPKGLPAVRIDFAGRCPGAEGLVEVARGSDFDLPRMASLGSEAANIRLAPGLNRYRLRCVAPDGTLKEEAAAQGRLVYRRSSGAVELPDKPPRNVIDADGRRYTVLYQTLLPELLVRWGAPPGGAGGPYVLHLAPGGGGSERTIRTDQPVHAFSSGEVREGSYRFWFESQGGDGPRSETSSLRVAFDNATPSAYIRTPSPRELLTGPEVEVSGAALDGASVVAGGRTLPLDAQRRFQATVPLTSEARALAIRIAHPRTGIDYYLRRRQTAP